MLEQANNLIGLLVILASLVDAGLLLLLILPERTVYMSAPSATPAMAPVNPQAKEIKAELIEAAATLTAMTMAKVARVGGQPIAFSIDPTLSDPNLQAYMTMASYVLKSFVQLVVAGENNTGVDPNGTVNGWGDPILPAAQQPGTVAGQVGQGVNLMALLQWFGQQPASALLAQGLSQQAVTAIQSLVSQIPNKGTAAAVSGS